LETGVRDRASRVLEHGSVRLVVTAPLVGGSFLAEHVAAHGDGVRTIALAVPDARRAHAIALARGAKEVAGPRVSEDEWGTVTTASIATYGDTVHTFVERGAYRGAFMPGYVPVEDGPDAGLLTEFDHAVGNVQLGRMNHWVRYYERVLGFTEL